MAISAEDDEALERLCADRENVPKAWLGGVLLRYGMRNVEKAITELEKVAASRKRSR